MKTQDGVIELSRGQIVETIDRGARERRGMGGGELVLTYRQGRLAQAGEVADLLVLADLLEEDDPFFTPA